MIPEDLDQGFRLTAASDGFTLEVAVVTWPTPSCPDLEWHRARAWSAMPSQQELEAAKETVLEDRRYFRVCGRCRQRELVGHMHDARICQACAEKYIGVVY
jgi:hypothetical protein